MEKVTLSFLGTGNAVPTKKRNHTAILLNYKDQSLLFDCGEGTQRQFKFLGISATKLTKLFITHWHGDHILGIPGLFQTLAMLNYNKTLEVYGPKKTKYYLELMSELFKDLKIKFKVKEIESAILDFGDFKIESRPMKHNTPSNAYSFIIKDKLRLDKAKLKKLKIPNSPLIKQLQQGKDIIINGKKIKSSSVTYKEKGKKITIILDTLMNPETIDLAKNSDILICESTFSEKDKEKAREYWHLTAKQAAEIAKKAKCKSLILTHISERYENALFLIEKEAKKIFKNTTIAKDLYSFEI